MRRTGRFCTEQKFGFDEVVMAAVCQDMANDDYSYEVVNGHAHKINHSAFFHNASSLGSLFLLLFSPVNLLLVLPLYVLLHPSNHITLGAFLSPSPQSRSRNVTSSHHPQSSVLPSIALTTIISRCILALASHSITLLRPITRVHLIVLDTQFVIFLLQSLSLTLHRLQLLVLLA